MIGLDRQRNAEKQFSQARVRLKCEAVQIPRASEPTRFAPRSNLCYRERADRQRRPMLALKKLVKDVERCEQTIGTLQRELETVNAKHQGPRSTRQDIDYLSALLGCARRKLAWEKQIVALQKRTPTLLQEMTAVLQDPENPPTEQTRTEMLQELQAVQAAMERLQSAKI
jgi:hypothetical protein